MLHQISNQTCTGKLVSEHDDISTTSVIKIVKSLSNNEIITVNHSGKFLDDTSKILITFDIYYEISKEIFNTQSKKTVFYNISKLSPDVALEKYILQ